MEERTADRRIRKTKKTLKDGLIGLMEIKSFKEITVKELTEKVDLNRGTFYLHYKDVFDMVEQIENDLLKEFQSVLDTHDIMEMKGDPLPLLEDIYTFLKENAALCTALFSTNGDIIFIENLKDRVRIKSINAWKILFNIKKADKFEYCLNFMLGGYIGLFNTWLKNGLKETPKEMALMTDALILKGSNFLK